ncbi:hypothetical protein ACOMHN_001835 [Nucella lapillus]
MATGEIMEEVRGKPFNPQRAIALGQKCLSENGDISLLFYIATLEEGFKCFSKFERQNVDYVMAGAVQKLSLMRELCEGESKEHYSTVQSMVEYETQHQLVNREDKPSGTVTLIRLNRIMEFAFAVLDKVIDPNISEDQISSLDIVTAYTQTLGRYHPHLMVASVMYALPQLAFCRSTLLECVGEGDSAGTDTQWLVNMTQCARKCYEAIQKVYADRGLLSLPQGSL